MSSCTQQKNSLGSSWEW